METGLRACLRNLGGRLSEALILCQWREPSPLGPDNAKGIVGLAAKRDELAGECQRSSASAHSGRLGLYVLAGVAAGVLLGMTFRTRPILPGLTAQDLGDAGMLVIQVLKTIAVPLVFFGIVDAILNTSISWRNGRKLLGICLTNMSVAFLIGLLLMNVLRPGHQVKGNIQEVIARLQTSAPHEVVAPRPLKSLGEWIPATPNICLVALLGISGGVFLRSVRNREFRAGRDRLRRVQQAVAVCYQRLMRAILGVIRVMPLAVFGLMAHLVSRSGLKPFKALWGFLLIILLGMGIHALFYYPLAVWVRTGMNPWRFLRGGLDAVITGLSTNSSLATVPVTLNCLTGKMGVSHASARLSACMGTNFNNDGITLYEAMAALFLAQACGIDLGLTQQAAVVMAAVMGAAGVAGVPEVGLMILPVVLGAAGLPETTIAVALPLMIGVDWLLARVRSGVNVASDLTVAVLLDGKR